MKTIWDIFVRLFHWLLVVGIAFSWWSAEQGGEWMFWHMYCGYGILGLIIFRVIWGFWGPHYARFKSFVYSPKHTLQYAKAFFTRQDPKYVGHNPLGGWGVLILLLFCAIQAFTGLFSTDDIMVDGPLLNLVGYDAATDITRFHKQFFNVLLGMIILHVLFVLHHQFANREKLIQSMFSGKKDTTDSVDAVQDVVAQGYLWKGLAAAVFAAAVVWGIVSL